MGALFWFGMGALATGLGAAGMLAAAAWHMFRPGSNHWRRNAPGRCRSCGCTDIHACIGADGLPCYWIEPGLCSECFPGRGISLRPPYEEIPARSQAPRWMAAAGMPLDRPMVTTPCENCDGTGQVIRGGLPCPDCQGTGRTAPGPVAP